MMEIDSKTQFKNQALDDDLPEEEMDENAKIFPQRLMEILSTPANADAITWLPHGRAFVIINRQKFANTVLPAYFRKTKYTSFTRKLNRWNFTRVTRGPELGAYYHEFFQRGNEALCTQMYCKNERAKFAVSKDPNANPKEVKSENSEPPMPKTVNPKPQPVTATPPVSKPTMAPPSPNGRVPDLAQQMAMLPKEIRPAVNPTLQTRAALLGQQSRVQDPLTQSLIDNAMRAFQSPLLMQQQTPESALLRMQQLAAMQHQLQLQQQQRAPNRSLYNNYRASAA